MCEGLPPRPSAALEVGAIVEVLQLAVVVIDVFERRHERQCGRRDHCRGPAVDDQRDDVAAAAAVDREQGLFDSSASASARLRRGAVGEAQAAVDAAPEGRAHDQEAGVATIASPSATASSMAREAEPQGKAGTKATLAASIF